MIKLLLCLLVLAGCTRAPAPAPAPPAWPPIGADLPVPVSPAEAVSPAQAVTP